MKDETTMSYDSTCTKDFFVLFLMMTKKSCFQQVLISIGLTIKWKRNNTVLSTIHSYIHCKTDSICNFTVKRNSFTIYTEISITVLINKKCVKKFGINKFFQLINKLCSK